MIKGFKMGEGRLKLDAQLPQFLEAINSEKVVHHRPSSALSLGLKVWEWSSPKQALNLTYTG
jgi:hypothetical protein